MSIKTKKQCNKTFYTSVLSSHAMLSTNKKNMDVTLAYETFGILKGLCHEIDFKNFDQKLMYGFLQAFFISKETPAAERR
jgi:hypothetical protein